MNYLAALSLLFIGLKLTEYVDWSWWVVLSPIWGPFSLIVFLAACIPVLKTVEKHL